MRIYLSPYVHNGMGWAPRGTDGVAAWGAIDLRPDPTRIEGWCLLGMDADVSDPAMVLLGADELDTRSAARRTSLQSTLGITLTAGDRFRGMLAEILIEQSRSDGTRWRGLQPTRAGRYEAYLGGQKIVDTPLIRGGAADSDDFNRADADAPGTNWEEITGDWDIDGNTMLLFTANGNSTLRRNVDRPTADHWCEATLAQKPSDGSARYGTCVRFSASAETAYIGMFSMASPRYEIWKIVAGSLTALFVGGTTGVVSDVVRTDVSGSTVTVFRNTVSQATGTDTAITGNLRVGLYGNNNSGATKLKWDTMLTSNGAAGVSIIWRPEPLRGLFGR